MAPSVRSSLPALLLTVPFAAGGATAPPPQGASGQQPITVDAASSEVDYKTNTVEFNQVVISQGATRVQAEHAHATGLNFANSRWTFDGRVRIDAEQHGSLRSDQAVVEFKDNHITRATITGKPAEFEQKRAASGQMARGHADEIVYDLGNGTVKLSEDAWLTDGQNEISGPSLVYNIRAQRVQADTAAGGGQRVHIKIIPHAAPGTEGSKQAAPESASPEPPPKPNGPP